MKGRRREKGMVGRFESEMEESCTCTVQTPGELSLFVKKVLFSGILLPFAFVFRFRMPANLECHIAHNLHANKLSLLTE